jgi:hypothetical protein
MLHKSQLNLTGLIHAMHSNGPLHQVLLSSVMTEFTYHRNSHTQILSCSHHTAYCSTSVSKVGPNSTGLNTFWHRALTHVIWSIAWEEGTHANEIKQLRTGLTHTLQNMTNLTGSSAYFNKVHLLTWKQKSKYSF